MKKVLVLSPTMTGGKLIMESFTLGLETNKCRVLAKKISELTQEDMENFKPDMILGYNYSFLSDEKSN